MAVFLHTRFRVKDLERSARFYCDNLGFREKSRTQRSPDGNQIVLLELPGNPYTLELAYSDNYRPEVPEDLIHIAIGVPDLKGLCEELEKKGIEIWPDGWREQLAGGRRMVFIDDPDGYEIELVQR